MLQDILKALESNPALASEVESIYSTNETNVQKIGELEVASSTLRGDIKGFKDMVRNVTGLTELSEVNLQKFAGGADDGLRADNQTLQDKLEELTNNYNGLESKHETEISTMILKDTMRGLGIGERVQNDRAFTELTNLVLSGAERDGANFIFKEDGKTIFADGGKPMNVEDRISQLQESEYSYLFRPVQGGGGGGDNTNPNINTPKTNLTVNQRAAAMIKEMN